MTTQATASAVKVWESGTIPVLGMEVPIDRDEK